MHEVHFLEVFHAGCYLRGHVNQRAETATRRTRRFRSEVLTAKLRLDARVHKTYTKTHSMYRLAMPQMVTL